MVVHEEVRWLDIPMDYVGRVQEPQATEGVVQQDNDMLLLYFRFRHGVHHLPQVGLPEIHYQEQVVEVGRLRLVCTVQILVELRILTSCRCINRSLLFGFVAWDDHL